MKKLYMIYTPKGERRYIRANSARQARYVSIVHHKITPAELWEVESSRRTKIDLSEFRERR
jgi:hypothetical protein